MGNFDAPVFQGPQPIDDPAMKWEFFWEKNKSAILGAVAMALLGAVGLASWIIYSDLRDSAAQTLLANASGIEGFQAVIAKYPGTRPAADALMRLAAAHREAGDIEKSTAAFQSFLDKFPDHPLAGGALLGIAQNQDAAGNADAAVATCQMVVTRYPRSYAAPFAAYSEAEILLRRFQREEALRSFNMVVSQFPQSPAARMAFAQLRRIGNTQPLRANIAEPATTAVPAE